MSSAGNQPASAAVPGGPPPWIDPGIQQAINWRDGDIVISVPPKSGTTWTMNIVHQLREGGDANFRDIYLEVPWMELLPGPGHTRESVAARINAMPRTRRRAFKTHSAPGDLPWLAPDADAAVQYIVVMRHPDEVAASFFPFIGAHSAAWFALWGMDKGREVPADFASFFAADGRDLLAGRVFAFLAAWWPLRHEPNVLLLHFADLKRDRAGTLRRAAAFLGYEPGAGQWAEILNCTSFAWMKAHEARFELRAISEVPILDPGAMVRKGKTGAAAEDGVTPAVSAEIEAMGREMLADPAALKWLYHGGELHQ